MLLRQLIKNIINSEQPKVLSEVLGYNDQRKMFLAIHTILNDPYLGLLSKEGTFDGTHSHLSLIKTLCKAYHISEQILDDTLQNINTLQTSQKEAAYKKIIIRTDYKREDIPAFAARFMEYDHLLLITNLEFLQELPLEEQLKLVSDLVRKHYQDVCGQLDFWGNITHYEYYPSCNSTHITLNTLGEIVK